MLTPLCIWFFRIEKQINEHYMPLFLEWKNTTSRGAKQLCLHPLVLTLDCVSFDFFCLCVFLGTFCPSLWLPGVSWFSDWLIWLMVWYLHHVLLFAPKTRSLVSERSVDLCQRTITSRSDPRGHALWATSDIKLEPVPDRPYLDMTLCLVETETFSSLFFFFSHLF